MIIFNIVNKQELYSSIAIVLRYVYQSPKNASDGLFGLAKIHKQLENLLI